MVFWYSVLTFLTSIVSPSIHLEYESLIHDGFTMGIPWATQNWEGMKLLLSGRNMRKLRVSRYISRFLDLRK